MKPLTILASFLLLIAFSCKSGKENQAEEYPQLTNTLSDYKSGCPYLTNDQYGNMVMSWVKELNDSIAYVCYAVSSKEAIDFSDAVEIKSSSNVHPHGENLPKIIFKPSGEIIAMWGASNPTPDSKYSGLVFYSQSFDNGKTWSGATALVKDTSAYDQRYFDMELLPNGEVMAIWLDNRGKKEKPGSTLFCAVTEGENGFTNEKPIGQTCCQCCRTDLFVDSKGDIHATYRDIINDSIRDMVHLLSLDGGKTFSEPVRISNDNWVINGCPHTGPTQAENGKGLHFAWYTMGGGEGVYFCSSADNGRTFSRRDTVSNDASAKHPQITSMKNGNIVIVWDETVKKGEDIQAKVGLQIRSPEGKIISSQFISEDGISEYAVIKPLNDSHVLVAYKHRVGDTNSIQYKVVRVVEESL